MQEFLAFVSVRFAAGAAALDSKKMRLHGGVAPGEQFHANAFRGLEDFAFRGPHEAGILLRGFEEGKDIGPIEACDSAQRADGGAHLTAFERAEKSHGDAGRAGHLRQREVAALTEAPEAGTRRSHTLGGNGNHALAFENVNDGSWI